MSTMKSLSIRTDVTAVKFYKKFVLAGIGSTVNIFDTTSGILLKKFQCLKAQKIYGFVISICGYKILVFGGKQFTILCYTNVNMFERLFEPVICDDWLHSGVWYQENTVFLLTAHNVTQKWDISSQTLISQQVSKDNSILYSGLLVTLQDAVLVISGTVFTEVIIHYYGDDGTLHHLRGHKGVIFSISCSTEKGIVVTTSDDRSIRIWGSNLSKQNAHLLEYWKNSEIVCLHELYGHSARVMRNCITKNFIVSVGEDSAICFWNINGELVKKNVTHQNSGVWSVDALENHLVTGGGDCAVIIHPLPTNSHSHEVLELGIVKKLAFTAKRNIVLLNDTDLLYYDANIKSCITYKLCHESTYKMLSLSFCKQMIAVADMNGKFDVFIENCKDGTIANIIDTKLTLGKILSMQWAGNRHVVFCSENGSITILAANGKNAEIYANFALPICKERWLTAAAFDEINLFALGDRCGNIHIYSKGKCEPLKTFKKVHGRYGPTSLKFNNKNLITTGRDSTIKYFKIDMNELTFMRSRILEFQWVEKFLNKDETLACGFQERSFVVYNLADNSKLLEVPCGGGHRSWDAVRCIEKIDSKYEEFIKLIYLKNSEIHVLNFELSKIVSRNLVNGSHSNNINCLKVLSNDRQKTIYVSGGEDTTVRISSIDNGTFKDNFIFKQLSNVKTVKIHPIDVHNYLILTAGGRAQICIRKCIIVDSKIETKDMIEYMVKGTDKERKGNQTWRNCTIDFDPETRIMDLEVFKNGDLFILAGCSDTCLRVFKYEPKSNAITLINTINYHDTCILKTSIFQILDKDFLITATTRGIVSIWDISDIITGKTEPIFSTKTNKSGINSLSTFKLSNNQILLATAGDDNTIILTVLQIQDTITVNVQNSWSSDQYHSSQITGLWLGDCLLISTSIDQRISLFKWSISDVVECTCLGQVISDVADIQGMDVFGYTGEIIKLCVFGKGMEVFEFEVPKA